MTDERRTSSLAKPRAYSMGTQAETRTAGGQGGGGPRRAHPRRRGLRAALGRDERDGGLGLRAAGHDPRGRRCAWAGAFAEYARPLGHGLALSAGAPPRRGAERGGRQPRRTPLSTRPTRGRASLTATDTLPAGEGAPRLAPRRLGGRGRRGTRRPRARGERALPGPAADGHRLGRATPTSARAATPASTPPSSFTRAGFRVDLGLYGSRVADYITVYDQARRAMRARRHERAWPAPTRTWTRRSPAASSAGACRSSSGGSSSRATSRTCAARQDGDPSRGIAAGPLAEMPPLRGRVAARYDDGRFFGSVEGVFAADQDRVDASLNEAPDARLGRDERLASACARDAFA